MQEHLAAAGGWFPPAPTFTGASAGGIVATNAAGAATFKYGSTRDWVDGLVVVLADGTILDVRRGRASRRRGSIHARDPERTHRRFRCRPTSCRRSPSARPVITPRPGWTSSISSSAPKARSASSRRSRFASSRRPRNRRSRWSPAAPNREALAFVDRLRDASRETWRTSDPAGIDAAAIENMDRRSIAILREDGVDARNQVTFPAGTAVALLVQLELPPDVTPAAAYDQIERALSPERSGHGAHTVLPPAERLGAARRDRARAAGRSPPHRAARRDSGGRAGRREPARRRGQARSRSAHREDRGRHGGPGRALRAR